MKYSFIPQPKQVVYYNKKILLNNPLYITASQPVMERLRTGVNDFCKEIAEYSGIVAEGILSASPLEGHINLLIDPLCKMNSEGYQLEIVPEGIYIKATSVHGLYYGLQTLTQVFKQVGNGPVYGVRIDDEPDLKLRSMMLDLRMQTFKLDYILKFIRTLAHYKINTLTIEYSDKFPYYGEYEVIRNIDCFSEKEIEILVEYCHEHFVDIIPFVQSFAHMEYILRTEKYRYLRESDMYDSQICPLHPDSLKVTRELLQQVAKFHKYSTHLCIGGDEPYRLGECSRCADYASKYGKGGLYVYYANKLCDVVKDMGLSTSICADKLLAFPNTIDLLDKDFAILDWDYWTYNDNPQKIMNWNELKMIRRDEIKTSSVEMRDFIEEVAVDKNDNLIPFAYSRYFAQKGFDVVGLCSTASVGPDCNWVPQYDVHIPNMASFCKYIKKYNGLGIINTAWERYLFELIYYGIIYCGEQCWSTGVESVEDFNKRFVKLFYGTDDMRLIEWQYKISRPFVIVEKKYPRVYRIDQYGRVSKSVFEIAQNQELRDNILASKEVFSDAIEKVRWNSHNLREWELGAKVRFFWYEVTRCYAEAVQNAGNLNAIKSNVRYLDEELSSLREDITQLLSNTMPEGTLNIKKTLFFSLYEELKEEMLTGNFSHTGEQTN